MKERLNSGDLVKSITGRDKGKVFLIVKVQEGLAYIVDGKTHKTTRLKKKNIKHLQKVTPATLKEFAERIRKGEAVSNQKVYKAIKAQQQKI